MVLLSVAPVNPLRLPSDPCAIVTVATNESRMTTICLACGEALPPALERSASLRCHDCRDAAAPIRAELVAWLPVGRPRRRGLRQAA
jgi:hypothetical protein